MERSTTHKSPPRQYRRECQKLCTYDRRIGNFIEPFPSFGKGLVANQRVAAGGRCPTRFNLKILPRPDKQDVAVWQGIRRLIMKTGPFDLLVVKSISSDQSAAFVRDVRRYCLDRGCGGRRSPGPQGDFRQTAIEEQFRTGLGARVHAVSRNRQIADVRNRAIRKKYLPLPGAQLHLRTDEAQRPKQPERRRYYDERKQYGARPR